MFGRLLFILLISLIPCLAAAQVTNASSSTQPEDIIYDKELSFGFKLHTNGFGASINKGNIKDFYNTRLYQIELMDIKHPKETREQGTISLGNQPSKSFKYGKTHNFYNINLGLGKRKLLTEKARKSGVAVSTFWMGGISIGISKPYYLEVLIDDPETAFQKRVNIRYSDETASDFLRFERIIGASNFSYGLSEIKFYPGFQAKYGVNFDWAQYDENIKSIEVGAMVNTYFKRIPLMATDDNHFFFVNFYIKVLLGKRTPV